jgi:hypothetical protein
MHGNTEPSQISEHQISGEINREIFKVVFYEVVEFQCRNDIINQTRH